MWNPHEYGRHLDGIGVCLCRSLRRCLVLRMLVDHLRWRIDQARVLHGETPSAEGTYVQEYEVSGAFKVGTIAFVLSKRRTSLGLFRVP